MPESKLEIQILARNLAKEALKSAQDELRNVGQAAKQAGDSGEKGGKKLVSSLTELKSGVDLAVGALSTLKETVVAVFEFGEAGAVVRQTAESFAGMGVSLGELRGAARGTVDDMTLMSSTLTLLAGAGPELQAALASAAPELLAMAKAANKLNPRLGDTTFLYQSIATAAKRQSSQIADNLGIIVKQGEAYETYAAKIGKSVKELSAEEQQLAFLNALLESGNVLLEQAGGSTESATDSFGQLKAAMTNLGDEAKRAYEGPLSDFFGSLAKGVDGISMGMHAFTLAREEYGLFGAAVAVTTEALGMNNTGIDKMRASFTHLGDATATATEKMRAYIATLPPSLDKLGDAARNAGASMTGFGLASQDSGIIMNQYNMAIQQAQASADAAAAQYIALAEAQAAAQESATAASIAEWQLASALGEVGKQQFVNMQLETLNQLRRDGAIDLHTYRVATLALQKQSGMLTTAEINAMQAINATTDALASGTITGGQYANQILNIQQNIDKLQDKTVRITIKTEGEIPSIPVGPEGKGVVGAFAGGGVTPRSGVYLVGERDPELVELPGGSKVYNGQETRQILSGDGGMRIENLTIQVQGPVLGSRSEVRDLARLVYDELGAMLRPMGARA